MANIEQYQDRRRLQGRPRREAESVTLRIATISEKLLSALEGKFEKSRVPSKQDGSMLVHLRACGLLRLRR